jgi:hypothetical protein
MNSSPFSYYLVFCEAKISSLNILYSYTLNLHFSLKVADHVSLPYKTTGTVFVVYILIFVFLDSKLEDKKFCSE